MIDSQLSRIIYLYLDINYETENFRWSEIITSEDAWNYRNALLYHDKHCNYIICVFYVRKGSVFFYETFIKNLSYIFENPELCREILLNWLIDKHIYVPAKLIY